MNAPSAVLRRRGSRGWLALAGGMPSLNAVFPQMGERLLEKTDLALPPLALVLDEASMNPAQRFLDELEVLFETSGAVRHISQLSPMAISQAGLVILAGGEAEAWQRQLVDTPLASLLEQRLGDEALILAAGPSAACFGSWMLKQDDGISECGLGWLPGAMVLPRVDSPTEVVSVRDWLSSDQRLYALGLPEGTALAVGPQGEVESWSRAKPSLVLGRGWSKG